MKSLQEYREKEQTKLFEEVGGFFAFSNDQLIKGVERLGGGYSDYVGLNGGFFCKKESKDLFLKKIVEINDKALEEDFKENGAEGIIRREFFNHETSYDGDESRVLEELKPYRERFPSAFRIEVLSKVFNECYKEEV